MDGQHRFDVLRKCGVHALYCDDVAPLIHVKKHRKRSHLSDRGNGGACGVRRNEHPVTVADAEGLHGDRECIRTIRNRDGVWHPDVLGKGPLKVVMRRSLNIRSSLKHLLNRRFNFSSLRFQLCLGICKMQGNSHGRGGPAAEKPPTFSTATLGTNTTHLPPCAAYSCS